MKNNKPDFEGFWRRINAQVLETVGAGVIESRHAGNPLRDTMLHELEDDFDGAVRIKTRAEIARARLLLKP